MPRTPDQQASDYPTATIVNQTGVPHFWFEQTGPEGERLDVLIVRATFDFSYQGMPMALAKEQQEIVLGDQYQGPAIGDMMRTVVVEDGDLLPYKPGTDILVTGCASAPDGQPTTKWVAGIRVGTVQKFLRLHGKRLFRKHMLGWRLGPTEAVTAVALDYRLAFGGCIDIPPTLTDDGEPDVVKLASNPAGSGWLPKRSAYAHLPRQARTYVEKWIAAQDQLTAPQIEDAMDPVHSPFADLVAQGFGAIARWWAPRVGLQGKYDEQWMKTRYPLLPTDFDSRYYQSAGPDLVATPHLTGNETVTLAGLLPRKTDMTLPGWRIIVGATHASGEITISLPVLDTVRFDLTDRQASLVWRTHFHSDDPVVNIVIAATDRLIVGKA